MSDGFLSPPEAVNCANKPPLRVLLVWAQPSSAKKPVVGWLVAMHLRAQARGSSKGYSPQPCPSEPPPVPPLHSPPVADYMGGTLYQGV